VLQDFFPHVNYGEVRRKKLSSHVFLTISSICEENMKKSMRKKVIGYTLISLCEVRKNYFDTTTKANSTNDDRNKDSTWQTI